MCKFKVGDKVKTRDGKDVEIVYVDERLKQPIIGLVFWVDGDATSTLWYEDGTYIKVLPDHTLDLTPPSRTVTLYQALLHDVDGRYFIQDKLYRSEDDEGLRILGDLGYKVVRLLTEYPIEVES